MDIQTLLTRQMELHSSVRRPPKTVEELVQLRDIMREYYRFLCQLQKLSDHLSVEKITIFQCFMHISVGGVVNFDKQHQDGEVPMHQAKVLARTDAIQLEGTLRRVLPHEELMVYVGMCKDLRTMIRVKVEDGNDLITAEKSIREGVEYVNFIDAHSHGSSEKMFAFYMVEDEASLGVLLEESGDPVFSGTSTMLSLSNTNRSLGGTFAGIGGGINNSNASSSGSGSGMRGVVPLPSPLSTLQSKLLEQCTIAAAPKAKANERLQAANTILDWVTVMPFESFAPPDEPAIISVIAAPVATLAAEKRSALCRLGCDIIAVAVGRASSEPFMLEDVEHPTSSPGSLGVALSLWATTLAKGIFVTVYAINTATDRALRELVIESHGHYAVVKALLNALDNGTQTELRRKCLGYLALSVTAANDYKPEATKAFSQLLVPIACKYVGVGDSPSRKMARALCTVLRRIAKVEVALGDERTEKLVVQEANKVAQAAEGGVRELERLLFGSNNFMASMRSTFSGTAPRGGLGSPTQAVSTFGLQQGSEHPHCVFMGSPFMKQRVNTQSGSGNWRGSPDSSFFAGSGASMPSASSAQRSASTTTTTTVVSASEGLAGGPPSLSRRPASSVSFSKARCAVALQSEFSSVPSEECITLSANTKPTARTDAFSARTPTLSKEGSSSSSSSSSGDSARNHQRFLGSSEKEQSMDRIALPQKRSAQCSPECPRRGSHGTGGGGGSNSGRARASSETHTLSPSDTAHFTASPVVAAEKYRGDDTVMRQGTEEPSSSSEGLQQQHVYDTATTLAAHEDMESGSTSYASHRSLPVLQRSHAEDLAIGVAAERAGRTLGSNTPVSLRQQSHQQQQKPHGSGLEEEWRSTSSGGVVELPAITPLESRSPTSAWGEHLRQSVNSSTTNVENYSGDLSASKRLLPLSLRSSYGNMVSSRGSAGVHGSSNSSQRSPRTAPRLSQSLLKKIEKSKGSS